MRHGENIRKRKDGRWEARYICSYNKEGKAVYRSVYGTSYEDAKTKRIHFLNGTETQYLRNDLSFIRVAELWLSEKKETLKQSSYNQYYNQCHTHLFPDFNNAKFSSIRSADVNLFLKKKMAQGYSESTVICLRTILMMIFRYARKNNILCSVNGDIFIPKNAKNKADAFTRNEQKLINEYLSEHPDVFTLAIYLSLYCGLRIGEVCALQWKDIHMRKETLTISKTMIRIQNKNSGNEHKTELIIQRPKTDSSIRTIPIPSFLIPILKSYQSEDDIFVITGKKHGMEPRVCLRKFKKVIQNTDIADYTFHACRHTFATRCIEVGIDPKTLSELLGHASVNTTLDRYVHPSLDMKRKQINKLEGIAPSASL